MSIRGNVFICEAAGGTAPYFGYLATAKRARTIFSPSPIHLEVSEEALMLKNVDCDWLAMHLPGIAEQRPIKRQTSNPTHHVPKGEDISTFRDRGGSRNHPRERGEL